MFGIGGRDLMAWQLRLQLLYCLGIKLIDVGQPSSIEPSDTLTVLHHASRRGLEVGTTFGVLLHAIIPVDATSEYFQLEDEKESKPSRSTTVRENAAWGAPYGILEQVSPWMI